VQRRVLRDAAALEGASYIVEQGSSGRLVCSVPAARAHARLRRRQKKLYPLPPRLRTSGAAGAPFSGNGEEARTGVGVALVARAQPLLMAALRVRSRGGVGKGSGEIRRISAIYTMHLFTYKIYI
jgi:hypothetical protein